MPVKLAEYGTGVFGMGLLAWTVVQVIRLFVPAPVPKTNCPAVDLTGIVQANTEAMTQLVTVTQQLVATSQQQTQLIRELGQTLTEMRLEAARQGRVAS